jgi:pimeloyl-ACP methyl ester carboxylesterase
MPSTGFSFSAAAVVFLAGFSCVAQQSPAAVASDPPADKAHPAAMESFQIPSHGARLNAIAYLAAGEGPHPVAVLLHGFPGNEKNLDLAQAIRRAGWDAVYFDYRGSWGSPGAFSFSNSMEDTEAAIAYLREPDNAARLRIDPKRVVLIGHSMGGWMAAYAGAHDSGILGTAMISAADMGQMGERAGHGADPKSAVKVLAARLEQEDILPLAGCTGESLARELIENGRKYDILGYAQLFGDRPLLLITSDDGLAPFADQLAAAVKKQGSTHLTEVHFPTDHSYSDRRIALEAAVLNWLAALP